MSYNAGAIASTAAPGYAGRYLLVVAVDEGGQAFVVTARDMTDAEKRPSAGRHDDQ
jgi:hypothetical protein